MLYAGRADCGGGGVDVEKRPCLDVCRVVVGSDDVEDSLGGAVAEEGAEVVGGEGDRDHVDGYGRCGR